MQVIVQISDRPAMVPSPPNAKQPMKFYNHVHSNKFSDLARDEQNPNPNPPYAYTNYEG